MTKPNYMGINKKHQNKNAYIKIVNVANYMGKMDIATNDDVQFYNGMERALSIIEDRPPVYKEKLNTEIVKDGLLNKIKCHLFYLYQKSFAGGKR
ncbi:MAG: hypothetical protein RR440_00400 [Erysipelotrichaceae bacterium]